MNPGSTLRFRRITGLTGAAWALLAIGLSVSALLFPRDDLVLPVNCSLVAGVAVWLVTRFGLLPLTIAMFVAFVLNTTPVTIDLSAWYAEATLCMLLIVTAIAVFGYTATRRDSIST